MTSKSAFEISSDQKVHLGSAATKIGKFSWPDNVVYDDVFSESEEKETNVARLLEKIVRVMETTEGKQQQ